MTSTGSHQEVPMSSDSESVFTKKENLELISSEDDIKENNGKHEIQVYIFNKFQVSNCCHMNLCNIHRNHHEYHMKINACIFIFVCSYDVSVVTFFFSYLGVIIGTP